MNCSTRVVLLCIVQHLLIVDPPVERGRDGGDVHRQQQADAQTAVTVTRKITPPKGPSIVASRGPGLEEFFELGVLFLWDLFCVLF